MLRVTNKPSELRWITSFVLNYLIQVQFVLNSYTATYGINFDKTERIPHLQVQGGSNMTGTDFCVNKSQFVPVIFEPPFTYILVV